MNSQLDEHYVLSDLDHERLAGIALGELPLAFDSQQVTTSKLAAKQVPSISVPILQLDESLFDCGRSTERKGEGGPFEVDMNLPFPIKLHYMLSNPKYQDYIAWLPHGRAWKIVNQKAFESDVIPKFFRSDRMASFMRQVNGWAFNRITEGPDVNAYYHEMFLRGLPNLCFEMRRPPKVKNAAAAARLAAGAGLGTPDFYQISKIAPLPPCIPFVPTVRDVKGTTSDKYDLEFVSGQEDPRQKGIESCTSSSTTPDTKGISELHLTKADVHYLKYQNKMLFRHGGFPSRV